MECGALKVKQKKRPTYLSVCLVLQFFCLFYVMVHWILPVKNNYFTLQLNVSDSLLTLHDHSVGVNAES